MPNHSSTIPLHSLRPSPDLGNGLGNLCSRDMAIQKPELTTFIITTSGGLSFLYFQNHKIRLGSFQSTCETLLLRTGTSGGRKMSLPARARAPSRALLSSLARTNAVAAAPVHRAAASQRRWDSTEQKQPAQQDGRSFKGQLYESTTARLQKEREERKRFAKQRNESAGGKNAALTFGMLY